MCESYDPKQNEWYDPERDDWYNYHYIRWIEDCFEELGERVRRGEWPWDMDAIEGCEVWEDGSVRMKGQLIVANNWVTPWEQSEHWKDWREK